MSELTDTWLDLALKLSASGYSPRAVTIDDDPENISTLGANIAFAWGQSAYPCVVVDEKLSASMAFTKLPDDMSEVEWPWDTLLIVTPAFIAEHTAGPTGYRETGTFLRREHNGFALVQAMAYWNKSSSAWEARVGFRSGYYSLSQLCKNTEDAADERGKMLARVVVGALCELNAKPGEGASVGSPPGPSRRTGLPRVWNFRLTRPVEVDHREHAREFLRTGKPGAFLQRLVRGHWQRYHVGQRGDQRVVLKHKEPYWHGNEDAPIALHAHVLSGLRA